MDLYGLVEEYAALGLHRTGTDVDHDTVEWLVGHLETLGFDVTVDDVGFDRWEADSRLLVDGAPVEHLPVFHEFTGHVATTTPLVVVHDPLFGGFAGVLDGPIARARAEGAAALVVATEHPEGSLVAINRVPGEGSGLPTALVAGRDFQRLADPAADVELEIDARLIDGRTANVIARRAGAADDDRPPLLVTTPLTGWFRCAGERGTGIAVLLDLVARLDDRALLVVATGGHELDYLGARRWLPDANVAPTAVVHLGASIAVEEHTDGGGRRLASTRRAMANLPSRAATDLAAALVPANLILACDAERWIGEAEEFHHLDTPLLSLSGAGLDFHTPADTPERATSPAAMTVAADAVRDAVLAFDRTVSRGRF